MKSIVIYDSNFGNTKKIAEVVAKELGGSIMHVSDAENEDFKDVDLLVVGNPIHGWRPSEKTIKFLSELKTDQLSGVKATGFDTRVKLFIHGDAVQKILAGLEKAGAKIAHPSEVFYVTGQQGPLLPGEIEKAIDWGKKIKEAIT